MEDSWICIEFKNHLIIPTYYSIRSDNTGGKGYYHPKSWVIEGLAENSKGSNWNLLSKVNDCFLLDGLSKEHTFPIQNPNSPKVKFIRIRQTGPNCYGNHYLFFSAIEFYGKLF